MIQAAISALSDMLCLAVFLVGVVVTAFLLIALVVELLNTPPGCPPTKDEWRRMR